MKPTKKTDAPTSISSAEQVRALGAVVQALRTHARFWGRWITLRLGVDDYYPEDEVQAAQALCQALVELEELYG